jgi:hypothetical protein
MDQKYDFEVEILFYFGLCFIYKKNIKSLKLKTTRFQQYNFFKQKTCENDFVSNSPKN